MIFTSTVEQDSTMQFQGDILHVFCDHFEAMWLSKVTECNYRCSLFFQLEHSEWLLKLY